MLLPARSQGDASALLDLEYSLFIALIPLLSPIAWDHYLVFLLLPHAASATHATNSTGKTTQRLTLIETFPPRRSVKWRRAAYNDARRHAPVRLR